MNAEAQSFRGLLFPRQVCWGPCGPQALAHSTRMRFIGVLQPLEDAAEADAVPVVADSVPLLLPHEAHGGVQVLSSELRPTKRQPQIWKTHYVCTGKVCGWSGSARTRHAERRPDCPFVPCPMRFRVGEPAALLVKEYLAQCTEAQARLAPLQPPGRNKPPSLPRGRLTCAEGSRPASGRRAGAAPERHAARCHGARGLQAGRQLRCAHGAWCVRGVHVACTGWREGWRRHRERACVPVACGRQDGLCRGA